MVHYFGVLSLTLEMILTDRQEYSHSPGLGVKDNMALKLGVYLNFNVQSNAQEWVEESKRLSLVKTTNNVRNSIYNGSTHLRAGILHHEPLEDHKSSNHSSLYSVRERMTPNSLAKRHTNMELAKHRVINHAAGSVSALTSVVNDDVKPLNRPSGSEVETHWPNGSKFDASLPKISIVEKILQFDDKARDGYDGDEHECTAKKTVQSSSAKAPLSKESKDARKALATIYEKVLVVDNVKSARSIVELLTTKYKNFIHACDTEVGHEDPW